MPKLSPTGFLVDQDEETRLIIEGIQFDEEFPFGLEDKEEPMDKELAEAFMFALEKND